MDDKKYPLASPHNSIEELFSNVYWVHGSVKMAPGMTMNRNMIILKQDNDLTLINPVRLNTETEKKLCDLGNIKRVIRLGDFHGLDDAYYVDRFNAEFWCQKGQTTYKVPTPNTIIETDTLPPIKNALFYIFKTAKQPEAALLLADHKLLITTDSIQNHTDWSHTSMAALALLKLMGFRKGLLIGKPWVKRVTPKGKSMRRDFEQLLHLDFKHLIAAHGTLRKDDAKQKLKQIIKTTFSKD